MCYRLHHRETRGRRGYGAEGAESNDAGPSSCAELDRRDHELGRISVFGRHKPRAGERSCSWRRAAGRPVSRADHRGRDRVTPSMTLGSPWRGMTRGSPLAGTPSHLMSQPSRRHDSRCAQGARRAASIHWSCLLDGASHSTTKEPRQALAAMGSPGARARTIRAQIGPQPPLRRPRAGVRSRLGRHRAQGTGPASEQAQAP